MTGYDTKLQMHLNTHDARGYCLICGEHYQGYPLTGRSCSWCRPVCIKYNHGRPFPFEVNLSAETPNPAPMQTEGP